MTFGDFLIHATITLALVGYTIGACGVMARGRFEQGRFLPRYAWACGALLLLVHIGCAFHFRHHWSHAAAFIETARQTRAQTGIDWGGGVYINYVFALVWLGDASWWSFAESAYAARPRALTVAIHAFLFFIVFNATVVFGRWPARLLGIAICVVLGVALAMRPRDRNAIALSSATRPS
jgi:hypothetical protein